MRFKDKIVLITGAGRGIGAATARLFAKEGAIVIVNYLANEEAAKLVLKEAKDRSMIIRADVGNQSDVDRMFDAISKKYGKIDILVNNAGVTINKPFGNLSLEDWEKTYAVNVRGVFLCTQKAIGLMKDGGAIVNISSIRGLPESGRPTQVGYASSKAAVINFTKTLAKEVAPKIRVNCVAPGSTMTDTVKGYSKELQKELAETILLKRLIEPQEIADAIAFLASDSASAITGTVLVVDGGQSLSK